MTWKKSVEDLPGNGTEVLVRCRSIVHLAVYKQPENRFVAKDGTIYEARETALEWKPFFPRPENGREGTMTL
jgi:hypothetical protein